MCKKFFVAIVILNASIFLYSSCVWAEKPGLYSGYDKLWQKVRNEAIAKDPKLANSLPKQNPFFSQSASSAQKVNNIPKNVAKKTNKLSAQILNPKALFNQNLNLKPKKLEAPKERRLAPRIK